MNKNEKKQPQARRHDPRRAGARAGKHEIGQWSHEHRADKKYRTAQAEGSRRYQEQLYRDAEFGRIARVMLAQFGQLFKELAAAAEKSEPRGKDAAAHDGKGKRK